jgi:hypothetical protein
MADEVRDAGSMLKTRSDGTWEMDVAAFAPSPEGYVVVDGVSYPIYSFLDVPIEDSVRVTKLGDDIARAATYEERQERAIEQVLLLNAPGVPKLTRGHFDAAPGRKAMSGRQLLTLTVLATSIAGVPPKAGAGEERASSEASPASAASTAGAPLAGSSAN